VYIPEKKIHQSRKIEPEELHEQTDFSVPGGYAAGHDYQGGD
jgi:hypothetical protein